MQFALFFLYVVSAAIILALGRWVLWVLSFLGIESWGLGFAFAVGLGVLISPTMVANHGVGLLPWILDPGGLSWGMFMSPVTCLVAWIAMGQPLPPREAEAPSTKVPMPPRVAPVLKFSDDGLAP